MSFEIKEGSIEMVVAISEQISEFQDPHQKVEYERRLLNVPHIILVAYAGMVPVGFKVGYEREGYFYSWMGGVKKEWRRKGLAKALANKQEEWARQQGYTTVTFKTRNRLKGMLIFALKNGFEIIEVVPRAEIAENRILLRKEL